MLINIKNDLLWHKISPKLLGQEISYFGKKFLPVTRIFFLWQEISSCDKKFLPFPKNLLVARNFLLWHNISCWGKYMFVITREFLPTFRVSLKISWEPGSLAPGEYPTLALPKGIYFHIDLCELNLDFLTSRLFWCKYAIIDVYRCFLFGGSAGTKCSQF